MVKNIVNLVCSESQMVPTTSLGGSLFVTIIINIFSPIGQAIVLALYYILRFAMNLIDFMQLLVQKLAGLDSWINLQDASDLANLKETDLVFRFLLSDTVISLFKTMVTIFFVLLIVCAVVAIIKNEYGNASGTNEKPKDHKKTIYICLRAIASVILVPFVLIAGILSSNAILAGLAKAFNVSGNLSVGGQVFVASAYDASSFRRYVSSGSRKAASNVVTFTYDEQTYTVNSALTPVVPRKTTSFSGYMFTFNGSDFYLFSCAKSEKDAYYNYIKYVLGAYIVETDPYHESGVTGVVGQANYTDNSTIADNCSDMYSNLALKNTNGFMEGVNLDALDTSSPLITAAYNSWGYNSVLTKTMGGWSSSNYSLASTTKTYRTNSSLTRLVTATKYTNSAYWGMYHDGGIDGFAPLAVEYSVMADVLDFMIGNGVELYFVNAKNSQINWSASGIDDAAYSSNDKNEDGCNVHLYVDYKNEGKVVYEAKNVSSELDGATYIMCYTNGIDSGYIPLINNVKMTTEDGDTYTFSSSSYASGYKGAIIAHGLFESSDKLVDLKPTYLNQTMIGGISGTNYDQKLQTVAKLDMLSTQYNYATKLSNGSIYNSEDGKAGVGVATTNPYMANTITYSGNTLTVVYDIPTLPDTYDYEWVASFVASLAYDATDNTNSKTYTAGTVTKQNVYDLQFYLISGTEEAEVTLTVSKKDGVAAAGQDAGNNYAYYEYTLSVENKLNGVDVRIAEGNNINDKLKNNFEDGYLAGYVPSVGDFVYYSDGNAYNLNKETTATNIAIAARSAFMYYSNDDNNKYDISVVESSIKTSGYANSVGKNNTFVVSFNLKFTPRKAAQQYFYVSVEVSMTNLFDTGVTVLATGNSVADVIYGGIFDISYNVYNRFNLYSGTEQIATDVTIASMTQTGSHVYTEDGKKYTVAEYSYVAGDSTYIFNGFIDSSCTSDKGITFVTGSCDETAKTTTFETIKVAGRDITAQNAAYRMGTLRVITSTTYSYYLSHESSTSIYIIDLENSGEVIDGKTHIYVYEANIANNSSEVDNWFYCDYVNGTIDTYSKIKKEDVPTNIQESLIMNTYLVSTSDYEDYSSSTSGTVYSAILTATTGEIMKITSSTAEVGSVEIYQNMNDSLVSFSMGSTTYRAMTARNNVDLAGGETIKDIGNIVDTPASVEMCRDNMTNNFTWDMKLWFADGKFVFRAPNLWWAYVQENTANVDNVVLSLTNGSLTLDYNFTGNVKVSSVYTVVYFNWLIMVFATVLIFNILGKAVWGLISRIYQITLLFLIMPAVAATMPLESKVDRFAKWKEELIKQVLGAYGVTIGLNFFFIIVPMLSSASKIFTDEDLLNLNSTLTWFAGSADRLNYLVYILFLLVAFTLLKTVPGMISAFVGSGDAEVVSLGKKTQTDVVETMHTANNILSGGALVQSAGTIKELATGWLPGSKIYEAWRAAHPKPQPPQPQPQPPQQQQTQQQQQPQSQTQQQNTNPNGGNGQQTQQTQPQPQNTNPNGGNGQQTQQTQPQPQNTNPNGGNGQQTQQTQPQPQNTNPNGGNGGSGNNGNNGGSNTGSNNGGNGNGGPNGGAGGGNQTNNAQPTAEAAQPRDKKEEKRQEQIENAQNEYQEAQDKLAEGKGKRSIRLTNADIEAWNNKNPNNKILSADEIAKLKSRANLTDEEKQLLDSQKLYRSMARQDKYLEKKRMAVEDAQNGAYHNLLGALTRKLGTGKKTEMQRIKDSERYEEIKEQAAKDKAENDKKLEKLGEAKDITTLNDANKKMNELLKSTKSDVAQKAYDKAMENAERTIADKNVREVVAARAALNAVRKTYEDSNKKADQNVKRAENKMLDERSGAFHQVARLTKSGARAVAYKGELIASSIASGAKFVGDKITQGASFVGDKVNKGVQKVGEAVGDAVSNVAGKIKDSKFGKAVGKVGEGIGKIPGAVKEAVGDAVKAVKDSKFGQAVGTVGKNIGKAAKFVGGQAARPFRWNAERIKTNKLAGQQLAAVRNGANNRNRQDKAIDNLLNVTDSRIDKHSKEIAAKLEKKLENKVEKDKKLSSIAKKVKDKDSGGFESLTEQEKDYWNNKYKKEYDAIQKLKTAQGRKTLTEDEKALLDKYMNVSAATKKSALTGDLSRDSNVKNAVDKKAVTSAVNDIKNALNSEKSRRILGDPKINKLSNQLAEMQKRGLNSKELNNFVKQELQPVINEKLRAAATSTGERLTKANSEIKHLKGLESSINRLSRQVKKSGAGGGGKSATDIAAEREKKASEHFGNNASGNT